MYLKSSSMSSTLASRLFDDLSFRSSSFILFCIIMVFLVIFSPGRPMRSAHGIHCRKMHLTYYKIDFVHYPIKRILDTCFFHIKNLTYDMCHIMLILSCDLWGFLFGDTKLVRFQQYVAWHFGQRVPASCDLRPSATQELAQPLLL